MTTECIICFESVNRTNSIMSHCGCVHVCNDCNEFEVNDSVYYYSGNSRLLYCSYKCVFNEFTYTYGEISACQLYKNTICYYGNIYKHQLKLLNECKYPHYFSFLNNHIIPDLTKIICEYLQEE